MKAMSSAAPPPAPGDAEGGLPADLEAPPPEEPPPESDPEPAPDEGGEDEGVLLATPPTDAPAKRDVRQDGSYLTPGAKGKRYTPFDGRGFDSRPSGANRRHFNGQYGREMAGNSRRAYLKGGNEMFGLTDYNGMMSSLYEEKDSSYSGTQEERKILESNYEVNKLIESLEKVDNNAS
jgi:hypothetical protein